MISPHLPAQKQPQRPNAEDIWRNYILRDTRPEKIHTEIYGTLRVPERILLPIKSMDPK